MRQFVAAAAGLPDPSDPLGPAGSAAANNVDNSYIGTCNSQEINYFDSFYDNKTIIIDNSIENVEKNIYFRDVHIFIDKIKNMTIIKSEKLIRDNLYTCFKNKILH